MKGFLVILSMIGAIHAQQQPLAGRINPGQNGPFNAAPVQRNVNQRQGQPNVIPLGNQQGPNNRFGGPNRLPVQQQQAQLSGQPSLVNIGGCSRGVSLRNADGSTLVCGFGPRDFACPPDFSCTFDNGLKALVCCPSENNTHIAPEKDEDQPNPCPDQEPIKDEFGRRLKCDFVGGPSNACPAGTLCVVGACCPVSVAGLISVKPGKCPAPLPVNPGQTCQNDCTFDADCPGPAKCCFVGCGARCVASVNSESNPQQPNTNAVGGPLSGNAASLAQFNLQQQQQLQQQGPRGPNGPQQNNPFFNQQQQQFQFPNNGPPGTFQGPRGAPGSQQRPFNGAQQGPQGAQGPQQPRPQQSQPVARNRQFDQP